MYEISIFLKDRLIGRSTFGLEEVRIGRSADNELRIDNPALSRYHASIEMVAGIHVLKDFGSQNGTFVNGKRVAGRTGLSDGDRIQVGKFTLAFRTERHVPVSSAEVRDHASYAVAGETMILRSPIVDRGCPFAGYLEGEAADFGRPPRHDIDRDVFLVGTGQDAQLTIPKAAGATERTALIVRTWRGFALVALAPGVRRNDKPTELSRSLRNGDVLRFGEATFTFYTGRADG